MPQTNCPRCGYGRSWSLRRGKKKCKRCRGEYCVRTYPVTGFRVTAEAWRVAIATFLRERSLMRVAAEAGVSAKTAQRMTHALRLRMVSDAPEAFVGAVEMDETYIGGQRKNKKLHIRRVRAKSGHGTDKLPIVGIFSRESGQVAVWVEPRKLDIGFVRASIRRQVVRGSAVYTDGFKMYRGIWADGYVHRFVDHDGGEYVRGDVHTNNIEGFWGIMKRKMGCIGGMRRGRLHLFVGEIAWKFNHRRESLVERERLLFELITRD
ncbi:MAG: IS1595 family transposase [Patescibacteria group bacterium]